MRHTPKGTGSRVCSWIRGSHRRDCVPGLAALGPSTKRRGDWSCTATDEVYPVPSILYFVSTTGCTQAPLHSKNRNSGVDEGERCTEKGEVKREGRNRTVQRKNEVTTVTYFLTVTIHVQENRESTPW